MKTLNAYVVAVNLDPDTDVMTLATPAVFFNPADALQAAKGVAGAQVIRISVNYPQIPKEDTIPA